MDTLYINQFCIFPLFERPLQPNNCLREAVASIFDNKRCFEEMGEAIYDYYRVNVNNFLEYHKGSHKWITASDIAPCPITNAPFILDLGQICFNTRSAYDLDYAYLRQWFAFSISKSSAYWRKWKKGYKDFCNIHDSEVFGYIPKLEDQRMNFLYFELNPPLKFRIYNIENQFVGVGKLFIHIYPTGHLSLHLAVSYIRCKEINTKTQLDLVIRQLAPWRKSSGFVIHSKLGKTSLDELVRNVLNRISHSFFSNQKVITRKLNWHCSSLIISDNPEDVLEQIIGCNTKFERIFKRRLYLRPYYYENEFVDDYICVHGKRTYYVTDTRRKGIIHSFWELQRLKEFIEYKRVVYKSYIDYFEDETLRIKKIQYGGTSFAKIFGKNFYQSDIVMHILALDRMVNSLSQAKRALYSYISDMYEFDECRERLLSSLNKWESQVKEWKDKEPRFLSLIDLILKPFELL